MLAWTNVQYEDRQSGINCVEVAGNADATKDIQDRFSQLG
jgi:hypothetical protein